MFARDGGVGTSMHPPARRLCSSSQNRFSKKGRRQNLRPFSFLVRRNRKRDRGNEMLQPTENEFEQLAAKGFNLIPVFEEVAADLETPVSAFLKIARGDYAFLLESVRGGEKWGRYTFLGSEPCDGAARARRTAWTSSGPAAASKCARSRTPFEELRDEMQALPRPRVPEPAALLRRRGRISRLRHRAILRDASRRTRSRRSRHARFLPDVHRHGADVSTTCARRSKSSPTSPLEEFASTAMAYQSARHKIDEMIERLDVPPCRRCSKAPATSPSTTPSITSPTDARGLHGDGLRRQGVHRGRRRHPGRAVAALRGAARPRIRSTSTAACARLIRRPTCSTCGSDDHTLVGASPEVMVRVEGREITLRPIAGTRRRGATEAEDRELEARAARRSQGARRARDAGRPRAQRRRPRRRNRLGRSDRADDGRALLARDAYRLERARAAARGMRRVRRVSRHLSARHGVGRAENPRDGNHRRARIGAPRRLRRRGRLLQLHRQHRHRDRAAHAADQERPRLYPGRRRRRRRFRPGAEFEESVNKARAMVRALSAARDFETAGGSR